MYHSNIGSGMKLFPFIRTYVTALYRLHVYLFHSFEHFESIRFELVAAGVWEMKVASILS